MSIRLGGSIGRVRLQMREPERLCQLTFPPVKLIIETKAYTPL